MPTSPTDEHVWFNTPLYTSAIPIAAEEEVELELEHDESANPVSTEALISNNSVWGTPLFNLDTPPPASVTQSVEDEYVENSSDYHVKYSNCYGILNNQILRALDFYNNDDDGGNDPIMDYKLLKTSSWQNKRGGVDVIKEIDWTLPHLGAINIFNTVMFIKRRHKQSSPSRYRKAFRLDMMDMYHPSRKEFRLLGKDCDIDTSEKENSVLRSIFFPNRFEVEEALDSVLSLNRLGAAFSGDYYFTISNAVNNIVLWRGSNIIGVWNKGFKGFDLNTSLFNSDLDNFGIKWEAA